MSAGPIGRSRCAALLFDDKIPSIFVTILNNVLGRVNICYNNITEGKIKSAGNTLLKTYMIPPAADPTRRHLATLPHPRSGARGYIFESGVGLPPGTGD